MSYCRWSEGDVYMYPTRQPQVGPGPCVDGVVCCLCLLSPIESAMEHSDLDLIDQYSDFYMNNADDALLHLILHETSGHSIPDRAWTSLLKDAKRIKEKDLKEAREAFRSTVQ